MACGTLIPIRPCSQCGFENKPQARFCGVCGASLAAPPPPSPEITILHVGRESTSDVVLSDPTVSARHARLILQAGRVFVEDLGSRNGVAINDPSHRITQAELNPGDTVFFGSVPVRAARFFPPGVTPPPAPPPVPARESTDVSLEREMMVLGRDPGCDIRLEDPTISRRHALLVQRDGKLFVQDLQSSNGTYINGQRIEAETEVHAGDIIGLGSYSFAVSSALLLQQTDFRGDVTIEVRDLSFEAGGRRLIEGISFTIQPGELVGLMGPSGSGKTTLMSAINGYQPPTAGGALFNGLDLYTHYDRFRLQLGYVPQDDIMHGDLTVYQALYYTARLRLPSDYSNQDIRQRIQDVLAKLGLQGTENVLIGSPDKKGISGGQRKRVNIAMELLTDPSVLFLDEPTSGLSSQDALMVMRVIRELADSGKTILMTIHQPSLEVFRMMHHLAVIGKDAGSTAPGRLVYFGPAYPDSIRFFHPGGAAETPEMVLDGLASAPSETWLARFHESPYYARYVEGRANQAISTPREQKRAETAQIEALRQWWTLVRRSARLKIADVRNAAILLAQPLLVGILLLLLFAKALNDGAPDDPNGWMEFAGKLATLEFLTMIAALWFGCNNSAREVVGEWAIYRRERMVNLKIPWYLASKYTVLGVISLLQCVILLGFVHVGCNLKASPEKMLFLLWLTAMVGLGLGLAVSSLARTSEAAIALVPLILLPMIMLGGILLPVKDMPNDAVRTLAETMASRWAFEGLLLPEVAKHGSGPGGVDMADHYFRTADRHSTPVIAVVLFTMLVLLAALAAWMLKRRDIRARPRARA